MSIIPKSNIFIPFLPSIPFLLPFHLFYVHTLSILNITFYSRTHIAIHAAIQFYHPTFEVILFLFD